MAENTLLSGHTLRSEGAPFKWTSNGRRYVRVMDSWIGKGLCSCGAASGSLSSNNARKRWHRAHKEALRAALYGEEAKG